MKKDYSMLLLVVHFLNSFIFRYYVIYIAASSLTMSGKLFFLFILNIFVLVSAFLFVFLQFTFSLSYQRYWQKNFVLFFCSWTETFFFISFCLLCLASFFFLFSFNLDSCVHTTLHKVSRLITKANKQCIELLFSSIVGYIHSCITTSTATWRHVEV